MKITWIEHSSFRIEKDGYTIVFDPVKDGSVPGFKPMREVANEVICSHDHFDHNEVANVTIIGGKESPFTVTQIDTFHDDAGGTLRGMNKITKVFDGKNTLVHMGDIGHMLNDEQLEFVKGADVMLIPVGGFYTVDAKGAAEIVRAAKPGIVVPMHYRTSKFGFAEIALLDDFLNEMKAFSEAGGPSIYSDDDFATQVVVLEPLNVE